MDIDNIKYRLWDNYTKKMYPIIGFDLKGKRVIIGYDDGFGRPVVLDPIRYDVMQFGGTADKNNIDIYERDIILTMGFMYAVVFRFGSFGIVAPSPFDSLLAIRDHPNLDESSCKIGGCEVVGNIYENPEILGGLNSISYPIKEF